MTDLTDIYEPFWMVWDERTEIFFKHIPSHDSAVTIAKNLAREYKDRRFFVLQCTDGFKQKTEEVPIVTLRPQEDFV